MDCLQAKEFRHVHLKTLWDTPFFFFKCSFRHLKKPPKPPPFLKPSYCTQLQASSLPSSSLAKKQKKPPAQSAIVNHDSLRWVEVAEMCSPVFGATTSGHKA